MNLDILHHFGGGVLIKETKIKAGSQVPQHAHNFDHLAYLVRGMAVLSVDDSREAHHGPACMLIKAGKVHEVQAVTDCVWLCVWKIPEELDETTLSDADLIMEAA